MSFLIIWTRNKNVRVVDRQSSFSLAEQTLSAQKIGDLLGIKFLVQGVCKEMLKLPEW